MAPTTTPQSLISSTLTYPERVDHLESALQTLAVIALDSLRAEYQLCLAVASLVPGSNIGGRASQLQGHANTVKDLISQLERKDIPF